MEILLYSLLSMLPYAIAAYFIYRTHKKAKTATNTTRHITIRVLVLVIGLALSIMVMGNGENYSWIFPAGFYCIWLVYMLVEAVVLFITKQNRFAKTSLFLFIFGVAAALLFGFLMLSE